MKRITVFERLPLLSVTAMSVALLFAFACDAEEEPAVEVVAEDSVAVTEVVDVAVAKEPAAVAEDAVESEIESPEIEIEIVGSEDLGDQTAETIDAEQDAVPRVIESPKTRQLPDAVPEDVAVIWEAFQFSQRRVCGLHAGRPCGDVGAGGLGFHRGFGRSAHDLYLAGSDADESG